MDSCSILNPAGWFDFSSQICVLFAFCPFFCHSSLFVVCCCCCGGSRLLMLAFAPPRPPLRIAHVLPQTAIIRRTCNRSVSVNLPGARATSQGSVEARIRLDFFFLLRFFFLHPNKCAVCRPWLAARSERFWHFALFFFFNLPLLHAPIHIPLATASFSPHTSLQSVASTVPACPVSQLVIRFRRSGGASDGGDVYMYDTST